MKLSVVDYKQSIDKLQTKAATVVSYLCTAHLYILGFVSVFEFLE